MTPMTTYSNRASTLRSNDPTITTPIEIVVQSGIVGAVARHADSAVTSETP